MAVTPDFDSSDGLKLVQDAYESSRTSQTERLEQYKRDYLLWRAYVDMTNRDENQANIAIPKIYSIVKTKVARDCGAILRSRPYIPFEASRKDFRTQSGLMNQLSDYYLHEANYPARFNLLDTLKTLYGVGYMDAIPHYKKIRQKTMVPQVVGGVQVGMSVGEEEVYRLQFILRVWAPWEIFHDPIATGLEEPGACRWVIKTQLASKREILRMAERGAYPDLDVEKLKLYTPTGSLYSADHKGLQMLSEFGLSTSVMDDDIVLLMRMESEDRYLDVLNNEILLRDVPNPYKHGLINLSRCIHQAEAHTQNQFEGIGEAKPNEVLQAMLSDTWNITFNAASINLQPIIYYKKDALSPDALVRTAGNRIPVAQAEGRPITDAVHESPGQPLPAEHFAMAAQIERMMDLTSGVWNIQRGEADAGNRTLGEAAMLREGGDQLQEMNVKLVESIFMKPFCDRFVSMVDQFATPDDIVEVLGQEGAVLLSATANPADLPGGYNYSFKGSDRIVNLLVKQRNLTELIEPLTLLLDGGKFMLARQVLEAYEFTDAEIQEILGEAQQLMMMQMEMAAQQQQMDAQGQTAETRQGEEVHQQEMKQGAEMHKAKLSNEKQKGANATKIANQKAAAIRSQAQKKRTANTSGRVASNSARRDR